LRSHHCSALKRSKASFTVTTAVTTLIASAAIRFCKEDSN
jgi:hypothetical protein